VVFVCGGDGTPREVAASLRGTVVPMALLPNGTANVLALALGVPAVAIEAAALYDSNASTREIDVGLCDGQPFLMMVSAGPDAVALARTSPFLKRVLGKAAVFCTGFGVIAFSEYLAIELRIGSRRETATLFSASNIPYYGGASVIAPDAELDDGLLDLVIFSGRSRRSLLGFSIALMRGRHDRRKDVSFETTTRLTVEGPRVLTMQLDGDPFRAQTPVEIELAAERLKLLLPADSPASLHN
jgi:diacylglycerol kinase family enzyme